MHIALICYVQALLASRGKAVVFACIGLCITQIKRAHGCCPGTGAPNSCACCGCADVLHCHSSECRQPALARADTGPGLFQLHSLCSYSLQCREMCTQDLAAVAVTTRAAPSKAASSVVPIWREQIPWKSSEGY